MKKTLFHEEEAGKNAFFCENQSTNQKTAYLTWKLSSLATCQSQSEFILSNLSMFLPNVIELKNIRKHTGEKPRKNWFIDFTQNGLTNQSDL